MNTFFKNSLIIFLFFLSIHGCKNSTNSVNENYERPHLEEGKLRFTIIYDNTVYKEGLTAEWGFSCLIEGTDKCILFDTGQRSNIFLSNMEKLHIDSSLIELVVISHNHGDHTGGLFSFLERNSNVTVYLPVSFHDEYAGRIRGMNARCESILDPVEICENVFLTGEMGTSIKEQSLIIDTENGLIVISGCAHPGIVNIVKKAREILNKRIYLIFGGFHLGQHSEIAMNRIISDFENLEVIFVGPTHCTGESQINMFRQAYGENFVQCGVGRVIEISDTGLQ